MSREHTPGGKETSDFVDGSSTNSLSHQDDNTLDKYELRIERFIV